MAIDINRHNRIALLLILVTIIIVTIKLLYQGYSLSATQSLVMHDNKIPLKTPPLAESNSNAQETIPTENFEGKVIIWPEVRTYWPAVLRLSTDTKWLAQVEGEEPGRLRIWSLDTEHKIVKTVLDSNNKNYIVSSIDWVGDQLVLNRLSGVNSINEAERLTDTDYNRRMGTYSWDPDIREYRLFFSQRTIFFGNRQGNKIAMIPFWRGRHLDNTTTYIIAEFPDGNELSKITVDINIGYSLWWSRDGQSFYVKGEPSVPPTERMIGPPNVLMSVTLDGRVKQLTPTWIERKEDRLRYSPFSTGLTTVTPLSEGGDIALFLNELDGNITIVYFDKDGPVKKRKYSVRDIAKVLKSDFNDGYFNMPASVTPDGDGIVFQNINIVQNIDGRDFYPICIWDLQTDHIITIGKATRI